MSSEIIGLFMIGAMLFAIFIGFPISFTLIFLATVFGLWGEGELTFYLQMLQFNSAMMEQTLSAVPLFIFMGILMEQAGLMERLFTAVQLMLSRVRGALYIAVLFVSTIFAAATGIVGASVTILGIMAAKTMNRSGYDVQLSAGAITAGGTLGILIPPSIMLVVMGPILEVPVTDLFAAAIIPGVLMALLYVGYALVRCSLNPALGPTLPEEFRAESIWVIVNEFALGLVPPAALVGFALGSILFGLATPTEGAAIGAFGAFLLTIFYRRLTFKKFKHALIKTLEISVLILFLVAASNFFGAVFSKLGTPGMLTEYLLTLELSPYMILIVIMALIFLLGWPLEWVPIVLIIVPILLPLVESLEFTGVLADTQNRLIWFGILVAVNLQTAWLSPPVALSAYFLKGVVPEWDLKDIYFGMMQFMVIQLLGLICIISFPMIALWLPGYFDAQAALNTQ
ncbi:MAG: TRAP transporter large permease subunit [Granulosicoccus sp.]|nr:TRAP transporter large permease subunit [Granulosicoccus sp.]